MDGDLSYYERRLREEREAAKAAECDHSRLQHEELAELYAKMLNALGGDATKLNV